MNLPTIIVLLVVMTLVIVAIYFLRKSNGSCSCGGKTTKGKSNNRCAGCSVDCPFKR